MEEPFCKIIPMLVVQCPFDCSVKGLLFQILRQIDMELDTHYYDMAVGARATTDMLIGSVSQIALNHIGMLIVDEIQNIVNHRHGKSLVGMLTQLINNSGISICMVGTPEAETFFESVDYLSRRALGLRYKSCGYNTYFREFCTALFQYQYVQEESVISDSIIQWLYEHSAGVLAVVVGITHDAQEISILNGRERLDMISLNDAYEQRMNMMHVHIKPSVVIKRDAIKKKKGNIADMIGDNRQEENEEGADGADSNVVVIFSADKEDARDWTFMELAGQAKKDQCDIVDLLKGRISITEITV